MNKYIIQYGIVSSHRPNLARANGVEAVAGVATVAIIAVPTPVGMAILVVSIPVDTRPMLAFTLPIASGSWTPRQGTRCMYVSMCVNEIDHLRYKTEPHKTYSSTSTRVRTRVRACTVLVPVRENHPFLSVAGSP